MMKGEMMHSELTFTAPRYSHFPAELSLIDFALFQIAKLRKRFWTPLKTNRVIMCFAAGINNGFHYTWAIYKDERVTGVIRTSQAVCRLLSSIATVLFARFQSESE